MTHRRNLIFLHRLQLEWKRLYLFTFWNIFLYVNRVIWMRNMVDVCPCDLRVAWDEWNVLVYGASSSLSPNSWCFFHSCLFYFLICLLSIYVHSFLFVLFGFICMIWHNCLWKTNETNVWVETWLCFIRIMIYMCINMSKTSNSVRSICSSFLGMKELFPFPWSLNCLVCIVLNQIELFSFDNNISFS